LCGCTPENPCGLSLLSANQLEALKAECRSQGVVFYDSERLRPDADESGRKPGQIFHASILALTSSKDNLSDAEKYFKNVEFWLTMNLPSGPTTK
jgi:hypothetical protein